MVQSGGRPSIDPSVSPSLVSLTSGFDYGSYISKRPGLRKAFEVGNVIRSTAPIPSWLLIIRLLFLLLFAFYPFYADSSSLRTGAGRVVLEALGGVSLSVFALTILCSFWFYFQVQKTGRPGSRVISYLSRCLWFQHATFFGLYVLMLLLLKVDESDLGYAADPLVVLLLVQVSLLLLLWLPAFRFFCGDITLVFPLFHSTVNNVVGMLEQFAELSIVLFHLCSLGTGAPVFTIGTPIVVGAFILYLLVFIPYRWILSNICVGSCYIFIGVSAALHGYTGSSWSWEWFAASIVCSALLGILLYGIVFYHCRSYQPFDWYTAIAEKTTASGRSISSPVDPNSTSPSGARRKLNMSGSLAPVAVSSTIGEGVSHSEFGERSADNGALEHAASPAPRRISFAPSSIKTFFEGSHVMHEYAAAGEINSGSPAEVSFFTSRIKSTLNVISCEIRMRCFMQKILSQGRSPDYNHMWIVDASRILRLYSTAYSKYSRSTFMGIQFCQACLELCHKHSVLTTYLLELQNAMPILLNNSSFNIVSWPLLYELFTIQMLKLDTSGLVNRVWSFKDIENTKARIEKYRSRILSLYILFWKEVMQSSTISIQKRVGRFMGREQQIEADAARRWQIISAIRYFKDRGASLLMMLSKVEPLAPETWRCRASWALSVDQDPNHAKVLRDEADRLEADRRADGIPSPMFSDMSEIHSRLSLTTPTSPWHQTANGRSGSISSVNGFSDAPSESQNEEWKISVRSKMLPSMSRLRVALFFTFAMVCIFVIIYFALCRTYILQPISSDIVDRDFQDSKTISRTQSASDRQRGVTLPFEIVSRIRRAVSKWSTLSRMFVTFTELPRDTTTGLSTMRFLNRHLTDSATKITDMHRQLKDSDVAVFSTDIQDKMSKLNVASVQNSSLLPAVITSMVQYYVFDDTALSNAAILESFVATLGTVARCVADPDRQTAYLNFSSSILISSLGSCSAAGVSLWYNGLTSYKDSIQRVQESYQDATQAYITRVLIISLTFSLGFALIAGFFCIGFIYVSLRAHNKQMNWLLLLPSAIDPSLVRPVFSRLFTGGAEGIRNASGIEDYNPASSRHLLDTQRYLLGSASSSAFLTSQFSTFRSQLMTIIFGIVVIFLYSQIFTVFLVMHLVDSLHAMYQTRYLTNSEALLWKSISYASELYYQAYLSTPFPKTVSVSSIVAAEEAMTEFYRLVDGDTSIDSPGVIHMTATLRGTVLNPAHLSAFSEYPDTTGTSLAIDMANIFTEIVSVATTQPGALPTSFFWTRIAPRLFAWLPAKLDKVFEELLYYYTNRTDLYRSAADGFFGAAFVLFPFIFFLCFWRPISVLRDEEKMIRKAYSTLDTNAVFSSETVLRFVRENKVDSDLSALSSDHHGADSENVDRSLSTGELLMNRSKEFRDLCPFPFLEASCNAATIRESSTITDPVLTFHNLACAQFMRKPAAFFDAQPKLSEIFAEAPDVRSNQSFQSFLTHIRSPWLTFTGDTRQFIMMLLCSRDDVDGGDAKIEGVLCSVTVVTCVDPLIHILNHAVPNQVRFGLSIRDLSDENRVADLIERVRESNIHNLENFVPSAVTRVVNEWLDDNTRSSADEESEQTNRNKNKIAYQHKDVSCIFQDIVSFTPLCSQLTPVQVVDLLTELYSRYDEAAKKYNVMKIKVMGDGSMWVSGMTFGDELPADKIVAAHNAVNFAFEMIRIANEMRVRFSDGTEKQLHVRVGIHTGELTSGVISNKLPVLDVFGATVNMSSRMESTSQSDRVHISHQTYKLVYDKFACTRRQPRVELKGIRYTDDTFFVSPANSNTPFFG
eukprot:ANDGO_00005.mRNA.1 Soluble guanylate cyclase 88E